MKARMLSHIYNPRTQEAEDLEFVISLEFIVRLLYIYIIYIKHIGRERVWKEKQGGTTKTKGNYIYI